MRNAVFCFSLRRKFAIAVLIVGLTTVTSCTSQSQTCQEIDNSDHYKTLVHSVFSSKAKYYNADERYLIIVDYSIPSNKSRMFLWDTIYDRIVDQFWCAHGFGGGSTPEKPEFSNTIGSNCSSLGWFLIDRHSGVSAHWGYRYYAVEGLDVSNSNARKRQILIHPWSSVTNDEANHITEPMQLDGRCAGCFTISEHGFEKLEDCIKSRKKRILLLAIDGYIIIQHETITNTPANIFAMHAGVFLV